MLEYDEDTVADLISRIQAGCYSQGGMEIQLCPNWPGLLLSSQDSNEGVLQGLRPFEVRSHIENRELWHLRHGRCTIINFARALDTLLALRFSAQRGPAGWACKG